MLAHELSKVHFVMGVGESEKVKKVRAGKVFVEKEGKRERLNVKTIFPEEFLGTERFDFIFLCVKNPVREATRFYFSKIKTENFPILVLPQNGVEAGEEGKEELEKILGEKIKKVEIARVVLFNSVSSFFEEDYLVVEYSLPICLAGAIFWGKEKSGEKLKEIFFQPSFSFQFIPSKDVKNMEYSKLFLNLVGLAAAAEKKDLKDAFFEKEIFKKEILCLREYIRVVKKSGGRFLNFKKIPVKFYASFVEKLPLFLLIFLRKIFAYFFFRKRTHLQKLNLDEVDYYTGAVIKLAKACSVKVLANEEVYSKIKNLILSK